MKRTLAHALTVTLLLAASPAAAECFADYKAKRDDPLRLQYGVIQIGDGACGDKQKAAAEVARRIGRDGWQLLNVVSVFGPEGLEQRRQRAGDYFLRY